MKNIKLLLLTVTLTLVLSNSSSVLAAGPAAVNLGTASSYAILTKTGISGTGATSVVGDMGVSPIAASAITGFALSLPAAGAYSTSALVTGKVYASDYTAPTPANLTVAISDMQTAYTDAMGRTNPTATELGAGNIGGQTLAPGLYKWGTGVTIPTDLTLSGGANDVWIFQVAQNLDVSSGAKVVLSGGAQAGNIFWVVARQTTLGTTAVMKGNILDQKAIVLNTGAQLIGRALAQTAVTLDANSVTLATVSYVAPTPTPTPSPSPTPTPTPSATVTPTPAPIATSQSSGSSSGAGSYNQTNQAQVSALLVTLHSLQMQVLAKQQAAEVSAQVGVIAGNLYQGSRGENVRILQNFLISQNKGGSARALSRVGATAYFGRLTRAALAEFQTSVGISPALGNFGTVTRTYVSTHN